MFKETWESRNIPREESAGHYAGFRRISWGAVFAGVVVALVVQMILSLLGLGIGFSTIKPMQEANPFAGLGTGTLIWWLVSMLISLFLGSMVAGRLAGIPKKQDGMLHGILTFSLFTLFTVYLMTTAIGGIISSVGNVFGQAMSLAGKGVQAAAPEVKDQVKSQLEQNGINVDDLKNEAKTLLSQTGKPELQPDSLQKQGMQAQSMATDSAAKAGQNPQQAGAQSDATIDKLFSKGGDVVDAADKDAAINVVMNRTGKSREEATKIVDGWIGTVQQGKQKVAQAKQQAEQQAREKGEQVSKAAAKAGIFGSIGLILGAIISGIGGLVGRPVHHRKAARVEEHAHTYHQ